MPFSLFRKLYKTSADFSLCIVHYHINIVIIYRLLKGSKTWWIYNALNKIEVLLI